MTDNGLAAIAADHGLQTAFQTVHGPADDARVDQWELEASRRALANLRELLYGQPMMDLLGEQIAEADKLHRAYLAASKGEFTQTRVTMAAKGISLKELASIFAAAARPNVSSFEDSREMAISMAFPAHPEHYSPARDFNGVVETMGGLPTLTRVAPDPNPPQFVLDEFDDGYEFRNAGKGVLADGTPHSYVLQEFHDTEDGLEASLRIWYPAACPPEYLAEHSQHYAIEFRNMLRLAAARMNH